MAPSLIIFHLALPAPPSSSLRLLGILAEVWEVKVSIRPACYHIPDCYVFADDTLLLVFSLSASPPTVHPSRRRFSVLHTHTLSFSLSLELFG